MMLRDVSSMNSTRTCVTPPLDPAHKSHHQPVPKAIIVTEETQCPAKEVKSLCEKEKVEMEEEAAPVRPSTRMTLTNFTGTLPASMMFLSQGPTGVGEMR